MTIITNTRRQQYNLVRERYVNGIQTAFLQSQSVQSWTDTRDGNPVPDYRRKIARGQNATSAYSCTFQESFPVVVSASATVMEPSGSTDSRLINGTPPGMVGLPSSPIGLPSSKADLLAREEFFAEYRSRRTAFQGGVFLGELRKTVQMIRRPAEALRRNVGRYTDSAMKRFGRRLRDPKVIAGSWLEAQYGWKPLIHDVEDALKLATAHPYRVLERIHGFSGVLEASSRLQNEYSYGLCKVLWTQVTDGTVFVKYYGAVRAQNDPPGFPEQCGASWSNVVPTAWELVPYSFLIDYFTNVGRVIDGVSQGRIALAWGGRATVKQNTITHDGVRLDRKYLEGFGSNNATHTGHASGGGKMATSTIFTRVPVDAVALGLGDFRFKLPGSGTKWLNIGALALARRRDRQSYSVRG